MNEPRKILGPAPVELRLEWLLRQLEKSRDIYRGKRTDALALIATPPDSRHPHITEAKLKTRAKVYGEIAGELDWLLSKHRPWNKPLPAPEAAPVERTSVCATCRSESCHGTESEKAQCWAIPFVKGANE